MWLCVSETAAMFRSICLSTYISVTTQIKHNLISIKYFITIYYDKNYNKLVKAVFLGFPGGSAGKESVSNAGDLGLIAGLGR